MRKFFLILAGLTFSILFSSCREADSKTTNTHSKHIATLEEKVQFLEEYVSFRREYEDLDFHVFYRDNSTGLVAGPSDWDLRIIAVVPEASYDTWIDGMPQIEVDSPLWLDTFQRLTPSHEVTWYGDKSKIVGIDKTKRIVIYRNCTL